MVISLAYKTQTVGLAELTTKILGYWGALILTILNLLFLLTALVAYLVLAGDMITSWFDLAHIDLNPFFIMQSCSWYTESFPSVSRYHVTYHFYVIFQQEALFAYFSSVLLWYTRKNQQYMWNVQTWYKIILWSFFCTSSN